MPVSTRSQIFTNQDDPNENQRPRSRIDKEEAQPNVPLSRNPHHRLREKMKALTLFYAQQQQIALKNQNREEEKRLSSHPSVELLSSMRKEDEASLGRTRVEENGGRVMRENLLQTTETLKSTASPKMVLEGLDSKENIGEFDRGGFSCPVVQKPSASNVVRKLSMPSSASHLDRRTSILPKTGTDLEPIWENCSTGSRILVFVRLRPLNKKEKEAGSRCCVRIPNKREVYLTEFANENDYLRLKRLRDRHFTFDATFPDSTNQQEVYATTTAELVEGVLQGRNGSIFCYGATGAGKTYTMLGTLAQPGVMVLAIKDLFSKIRQRSCDGNHLVHLSYLEVYNETVRDLLSPGRPLVLREDKQGIVAAGLTQYRAYSTDEVMALLQQGNQNRTTEPTRANETSSRSHAILQVVAEYKFKDGPNIINRVGKLSLIDLAGSERALATDQRTIRSLEGANINRSLLALSSCINALVEGKKHIPYRNSKLTQLLKDSLGGSCNTVMIANISPSNLTLGETQNTLHWADRAKEIRTKSCGVNEEMVQLPDSESDQAKLLLDVQKENRDLRMQLARCQQKLLTVQAQSLAASSPTPSSASSLLSPHSAQPKEKRRSIRSNILAVAATANCFNTPELKKKRISTVEAEETIKELRRTVQALESDLERIKKEHELQIKQKNDFIRDICLNQKATTIATATAAAALKDEEQYSKIGEKKITKFESNQKKVTIAGKRVVHRSSLAPPEPARARNRGGKSPVAGDLKSPSHRFLSPAPTAKKRSYWDITTANSPSVAIISGRSTRSHVAVPDLATAPSMLLQLAYPCFWFVLMLGPHMANYILQPGFARQQPIFPNP